ncbi:MAG: ABC transporter ATP-binding protein [Chloroflexota bacterium]
MGNIIETENVVKLYQSNNSTVKAVDNVSIYVGEGEFVALVGPSGSGKTTMLAMLAALLEPTDGSVRIDGQDIGRMKESDRVKFRRERIGFTFQSNNLVPYLTVRENVEMMLRLNKKFDRQSKARVLELLERLGMQERLNSLPSQLSGGQRQRVAIARSMIHNPSVILADEPTASLDTERAFQVTRQYADLIHENNRAGIMVTHDLRMCKYVDRIIQIHDGQISSVLSDRAEIDAMISCA